MRSSYTGLLHVLWGGGRWGWGFMCLVNDVMQGLYSPIVKTFQHQISSSFATARLGVKIMISFWNLKAAYAALLPRRQSIFFGSINNFIFISIGFENSWDLNTNISSYQYRDNKDKTVWRSSYPIPGKTVFILRRGPGDKTFRLVNRNQQC